MATKYTPQVQLDMFAPVQLGLGIDPTPARHLTALEAEYMAGILYKRMGTPIVFTKEQATQELDLFLAGYTYTLDNDSRWLVFASLDELLSADTSPF